MLAVTSGPDLVERLLERLADHAPGAGNIGNEVDFELGRHEGVRNVPKKTNMGAKFRGTSASPFVVGF